MTGQPGQSGQSADPWRSFRGVMAATLMLEAIVVLLALPVVAKASAVGGGLTPASLVYLVGLALALVLLTGIQGRPWAIWVNLALQVVPIAGFLVYPGIGVLGVLFTVVWLLIIYFRAEVLRRQHPPD